MTLTTLLLYVAVGLSGIAMGSGPLDAVAGSALSRQVVQGERRNTPTQVTIDSNVSSPTVGWAAISGIVTDGATGRPLKDALVQLLGPISSSGGAGGGVALARPRQRTDSRGRFIFTHLPAGNAYAITATRQGYFDGGYRSRPGTVGGSRIDVRDGEWLAKTDIALWKPAAISGIVRDERGEPIVGVAVQALLDSRLGGRVRRASGPSAVTDDRGMYRLANLRPGRYLIHVPSIQVTLPDRTAAVGLAPNNSPDTVKEPPLNLMRSTAEGGSGNGLSLLVGFFPTAVPSNQATAYPMIYHPSARSIDQAAPVAVGFGEQRTFVDVQLMMVPSFLVRGRVLGPSEVMAHLPVRLVPSGAEDLGVGAEAALTMTDAHGEFTFLRVPAGEYTVVASTTQGGYGVSGVPASRNLLPSRVNFFAGSMTSGTIAGADGISYNVRGTGGAGAFGRSAIVVGARDIEDLEVVLTTGVTVSGHFIWDGSSTPPQTGRIVSSIRLEPADGNLTAGMPFGGTVRTQEPLPLPLAFSVQAVLPGRYVVSFTISAPGFVLEAVEHGGRDLSSTPLVVEGDRDITGIVIRMTSKPTSLTGFVRVSSAKTADSGAVLFFPVDRTLWQDAGVTAQRFATATVAVSGAYRAPSLPPGEYYAVAVPDVYEQRLLDPEFLASLATNAVRITLAPGSKITKDLSMTGGGR